MPEPGTPAWQELVGAVHTDATAAEQAKVDAQTAAQQAGASAGAAATSAANAGQRAQQAADSLQELKDGIANGEFKGEPGNDGKSPVVTVTDIENGHRVSITDKDGTKTIDVLNGQTGKTGATPVLTIGTVSSGDKPSADITGTPENPVLNLRLQPGPQGPAVALDTTLTHEGEAADAKATGDAISAVKARQNVLVGTETGNPISVDDAFPAPLCGLTVYGRSTQNGTPTPDAPVPIVSAGDGGSLTVKVTGKNIFPGPEQPKTVERNGLTFSYKDGVYTLTGTSNENTWFNIYPVIDNTTSTSHNGNTIYSDGKIAVVNGLKNRSCNIAFRKVLNNNSTTIITADNNKKLLQHNTSGVFIYTPSGTYSETFTLMITGENQTEDYEPYREQLLTLPTPNGLPGIPVTSGGNYADSTGQQWVCDEVDLERGAKVQRIDKGAFDATKTLAEQNAILATPIETPLTPAEIATYKVLATYGPDTVVQAGDGAGIKLDYQRDVNLVVKNLEDAVASMTNT